MEIKNLERMPGTDSVTINGTKFTASDKIAEGNTAPYMPDSPFNHKNWVIGTHVESDDPRCIGMKSLYVKGPMVETATQVVEMSQYLEVEESLRTVRNTLELKSRTAALRQLRIHRLELHVEKLKELILLTDPAVHNVQMNDLSLKQWNEYADWCNELEIASKQE